MRNTTKKRYNSEEKKENKIKKFIKWGWNKLVIYFRPFLRVTFLISYGMGWIITNGWTYVVLGAGIVFHKPVLIKVMTAYIGFLWMPWCTEGIITIAIALVLQEKLFSKDAKTKAELLRMQEEARHDFITICHKVRLMFNGENIENANLRAKKRLDKVKRQIDRQILKGASYNDLKPLYAKMSKIEEWRERKVLKREYNIITFEVKERQYKEGVLQKRNNGLYTAQSQEVETARVEIEDKKTGTIELVGRENNEK